MKFARPIAEAISEIHASLRSSAKYFAIAMLASGAIGVVIAIVFLIDETTGGH